jgi:hypothetical protein
MSYFAIGADVSVNHSAIVVLDGDGQLVFVRYLCQKVMDTHERLGGTRIMPQTKAHKVEGIPYGELYQMERLVWLYNYYNNVVAEIVNWILSDRFDDIEGAYIGLESYAYKGKKTGSNPYQIGEAAAIFKLHAKMAGLDIRLHDPTAVKMFATDMGNASKEEVQAEAVKMAERDDCGLDLMRYPTDKDGGVRGDVADAYVLAKMVQTEVEVRAGRIQLHELEGGPLRIYNRVTKTNPVNLLARPWL